MEIQNEINLKGSKFVMKIKLGNENMVAEILSSNLWEKRKFTKQYFKKMA